MQMRRCPTTPRPGLSCRKVLLEQMRSKCSVRTRASPATQDGVIIKDMQHTHSLCAAHPYGVGPAAHPCKPYPMDP